MTESLESSEPQGLSRRQALRRVAIAGGTVAWATPIMQTIGMNKAFAQTTPSSCRMTGGGHLDDATYGRVSHGFELHCDLSLPNNLEVNWGEGNSPNKKESHKFKLDVLTSAACTDDPAIDPDPPRDTGLDTFTGSGTGEYDHVPGAVATWTFTDAGEPGRNDRMKITVLNANAQVVLNVNGTLGGGNHQMHCKK
jgi:hypothetical protein